MEVVVTQSNPQKNAARVLREVLLNADHPILFLTSGGSWFDVLRHLNVDGLFDEKSLIGVLDERYSRDPSVNNFAQLLKQDICRLGRTYGCAYIDTRVGRGEKLRDLAERFERCIREWHERHPDGSVVVTMGIGSDGHTAGILPAPDDESAFLERFVDTDRFVVGYEVKPRVNPHTQRVTTTIAFLVDYVDTAVVYAVGAKKHAALERVMAQNGTLAETPARVLRQMRDVVLVTDRDITK